MQLLIPVATPHRFTVAEYMALEIAERTELLEGVIYDVSPRNEAHRRAIRELSRALIPGLLGSGYVVQTENAVAVPEWQGRDAPEVDVAVLADKVYRPGPTAADAFAFIEVSHTTYALDRKYKIPLYVRAGVPSWIVNIPLRQVEYYGAPKDLETEHGRIFTEHDAFDVLGIAIPVAALFDQGD